MKIGPGIYQHYKGNKYLVLANAKHSETLEEMVAYVSLYENKESQVWVRPAKMFAESVEWEGKSQPRFVKLSD
ncbi:DUF1653 domain-containing protein [Candidatus Saccharibacteria bacterium]|nr:DUF1653 domain-containing protein [Candidatus Saccharibacteria bacterium]